MIEQHFKNLFKNLSTAYSYHKVILDDQGNPCDYVFLEVNEAYENTMNLKASDIAGKSLKEVYMEEWRQEAEQLHNTCLDALTNHKTVSIDLPNNFTQKWFRISVVPVNEHYFFCIFIDVTTEYMQKQEIEAFLQANLDMLCVADTDGNFINANKEFANALGYSAEELEGKSFLSLVHEDDLSKNTDVIKDLKEQKPVLDFINRYRCKDGSYKYLEWHSQSKGEYLYASARDITKKIEDEKAIKENLIIKEKHLQLMKLNNITIEEFLNKSLEYVIEFTGSKLGYIFLYDEQKEEFLLHSWSEAALQECKIKDKQKLYYLGKVGLWGEVVRQMKPIIINDYMSPHVKKNGYPEGHVQIKNFLSIPVYIDGQVVAVVGVANKEIDYNEEDILNLKLLMNTVWSQVERKKSEEALKKSVKEYRLLTEYASDVIWILNLTQNKYTYISPSILQLRGYTKEEVMAQSIEEVFTPESKKIVLDAISRGVNDFTKNPETPNSYITELQQICKNGEIIWVEDTTRYRYNSLDEIEIVGASRNIEERKKAEKEILYLSYHDQLTGLYNRHFFDNKILEEIERSDRYKETLSMIILDLDHFKLVNDTWGHPVGDEVLKQVAETIISIIRKSDVIIRLGGEEFIVLMPYTTKNGAFEVAEKIRKTLENNLHPIAGQITASFGVAERESAESFKSWYKRVDEALYRAKEDGRNRVVIADDQGSLPVASVRLEWRD